MVHLTYETLSNFALACFKTLGMRDNRASEVVNIFLRAQWRDQKHHDFSLLPQRLGWLYENKVSRTAEPEMIFEDGGAAIFDGHNCLGEIGCSRALTKAIELAEEHTIGLASVRNTNHYLAGSPYSEIAGEKGMLALVVSSTDRTMAGPEGGRQIIGNNPLSFGAPLQDRPFLLDICMAYASLGTLHRKKSVGEQFPEFFGFDGNGNPSGNPDQILNGGSLAPIAQHKGFGLALMVEILTGGLNQGPMGLDIPTGGGIGGHSQTIFVINFGRFPGADTFSDRFMDVITRMNEVQGGIRYPGSRRTGWSDSNLPLACEVTVSTYVSLKWWAEKLGVEFPPAIDN
ncbi:MAG: Ldh family oxidoreductase [Spirochaetales bacterium]|nr:Ldh family oxidoreductase [Spirochaetales bacterium]